MAKLTNEEIIASLKEMSILELNDLVKAIEEEFGVTAAAPVAVAAVADDSANAGPSEVTVYTHRCWWNEGCGHQSRT